MSSQCWVATALQCAIQHTARIDNPDCAYTNRASKLKDGICEPCIEAVTTHVKTEARKIEAPRCVVCTLRKPMSGKDLCKNCDRRIRRYVRNSAGGPHDLICQNCHEPYQAQRRSSKYCSPKCRQAKYRERGPATERQPADVPLAELTW